MRLFDLHCDSLSRGERGYIDCTDWVQTYAAFLPDGLSCEQAWRQYDALMATAVRWGQKPSPCTALLSVENGGMLHGVDNIFSRLLADNIRMVGLTWNGDNAWGSGCGGIPDGALTDAGMAAVHQLERCHITVDVSHLNAYGFWQLERLATRPFIATHSNAAAICPHPRNLTDDQFCAIRDRGGLVGLNIYPPFLGEHSPQAFCRHWEHFLSLDGADTVCIGSDIDGFDTPPLTVSYLQTLYTFMTDEGYDSTLIDKLFYGNARRFFDRAVI